MTEEQQKEQEQIFSESKCPFKIGDKVRHKANPEFRMIIIDYSTNWIGNMRRKAAQFKNPDLLVCKYYDVHKKQWIDKQVFQCFELEPDSE